MDKTRFNTIDDELAYWAMIEKAAKDNLAIPEHDCKIGGGCQIEQDYHDSRKWWLEQKSNKSHTN